MKEANNPGPCYQHLSLHSPDYNIYIRILSCRSWSSTEVPSLPRPHITVATLSIGYYRKKDQTSNLKTDVGWIIVRDLEPNPWLKQMTDWNIWSLLYWSIVGTRRGAGISWQVSNFLNDNWVISERSSVAWSPDHNYWLSVRAVGCCRIYTHMACFMPKWALFTEYYFWYTGYQTFRSGVEAPDF